MIRSFPFKLMSHPFLVLPILVKQQVGVGSDMIKQSSSWVDIVWERILPVAVLGILLAYTYIELGYAPYVGFNFSSPTGEITLVFVTNPNGHNLKVGDMIRQVDNVSWENYQVNLRQRLFPHVHVGQLLTLHILRGGKNGNHPET